MTEKYELPFKITATLEKFDIIHRKHIKQTMKAAYIKVYKNYTGWGDQLEIVDANGCCISPKKYPKISNDYVRILNMYNQGKLRRV